ncbi:MAG TPA: helix-turn-helix transcriptional regulator, partial [Polyangiaceae bacterium]
AIDLGLAPSTIALNSRLALQSIGLACRPSRAHPLLMLAASPPGEPALAVARCANFSSPEQPNLLVIGTPRPDRHLGLLLPSAELAVIRSLVEGLSYEEIAHQRGTSTRTIANQITAVFRRLRVSGRNELVQRLFFDETLGKHVPQRPSQTLIPPGLLDPKTDGDHWDAPRRSA